MAAGKRIIQLATHSHQIRERSEWELTQEKQQKSLFSWISPLIWLIMQPHQCHCKLKGGGENRRKVASPHLVAAYNLDGLKLLQTSIAETKEIDLHLWRYDRSSPFQQVAYQDPWCHDTAVFIVEAMSCKPLVSQEKITWKKKRQEEFHQQECTAKPFVPPMHPATEAEESKLALNHWQGEALLRLARFVSTEKATIRLEESEDVCCTWRGNRSDLL